MMTKLLRKLEADPTYSHSYFDFLNEYERLKYMTFFRPQFVYYLPYHDVIRESSLTTKLRVVFNGSSRTDTGFPLNDILHIGPKLQVDLFNVLLWFRQFRYVFSSDMEKMSNQTNQNTP